MTKDKLCRVCGDKAKYGFRSGDLLCNKHYLQIQRHGKTFETKYSPNNYFIIDDTVFIEMVSTKGVKNTTTIDVEDKDIVLCRKWYKSTHGYAVSKEGNRTIWLHRLVMKEPSKFVDHRDRNKLNNCKSNLRVASHQENQMNETEQSNNTSGFRGVVYHKASGKWMSRIKVNQKEIYLGLSKTIDEAIEKRKKAELEYFKEYSPVHKNEVI